MQIRLIFRQNLFENCEKLWEFLKFYRRLKIDQLQIQVAVMFVLEMLLELQDRPATNTGCCHVCFRDIVGTIEYKAKRVE